MKCPSYPASVMLLKFLRGKPVWMGDLWAITSPEAAIAKDMLLTRSNSEFNRAAIHLLLLFLINSACLLFSGWRKHKWKTRIKGKQSIICLKNNNISDPHCCLSIHPFIHLSVNCRLCILSSLSLPRGQTISPFESQQTQAAGYLSSLISSLIQVKISTLQSSGDLSFSHHPFVINNRLLSGDFYSVFSSH